MTPDPHCDSLSLLIIPIDLSDFVFNFAFSFPSTSSSFLFNGILFAEDPPMDLTFGSGGFVVTVVTLFVMGIFTIYERNIEWRHPVQREWLFLLWLHNNSISTWSDDTFPYKSTSALSPSAISMRNWVCFVCPRKTDIPLPRWRSSLQCSTHPGSPKWVSESAFERVREKGS